MKRGGRLLLSAVGLATLVLGAYAGGEVILRSGVVRTGCDGPLQGTAALLRGEAGEGCAARLARSRRGRMALRWLARDSSEALRIAAWGGLLHTPWTGWREEREEAEGPPPEPGTAQSKAPPQGAPPPSPGPSTAAATSPAPSDDSREEVPPADRVLGTRGARPVYARRPLPAPESPEVDRARDQVRWRQASEAPWRAGLLAILERPEASLAVRRAALRALEGHPGDMEVLERAAAIPGLRAYALERLGARDPAWAVWATRLAHVRALRARACGASVDVPPTLPAAEAPPDAPARHAWDVVAGMLLGEETESADMARLAIHGAERWIAEAPERERPARLLALVAPEGALPGRPCEGGDAAAALEGVGTPPMAALLAEALGVPLGIEVGVAAHGDTVRISVDGEVRVLRSGHPITRGDGASWGPRGAGAALALEAALARASRAPETLSPRHAAWLQVARAAWPGRSGWIARSAPLRLEGLLETDLPTRALLFDGSPPPPAPPRTALPARLRPRCATRGFHPACSIGTFGARAPAAPASPPSETSDALHATTPPPPESPPATPE
jgi:hypothetical protein